MKKKVAVGIILAAALAVQSMTVFAAGSSESESSNASSSTSSSTTTESTVVTVTSTGVKTTEVATSTTAGGSSIAMAVDGTTASGQTITINSNGEAVVGDKILAFAKDEAATAGLPASVVETINGINSGRSLSEIVSGVDLTGYTALTGTHAIVTKNAQTGVVSDTATEAAIYVPNLVDGLEISLLYYDNATGRWVILPATKIDAASKVIYTTVPGSGTLSVIYKKN